MMANEPYALEIEWRELAGDVAPNIQRQLGEIEEATEG
jgi:hypothetical protein